MKDLKPIPLGVMQLHPALPAGQVGIFYMDKDGTIHGQGSIYDRKSRKKRRGKKFKG